MAEPTQPPGAPVTIEQKVDAVLVILLDLNSRLADIEEHLSCAPAPRRRRARCHRVGKTTP